MSQEDGMDGITLLDFHLSPSYSQKLRISREKKNPQKLSIFPLFSPRTFRHTCTQQQQKELNCDIKIILNRKALSLSINIFCVLVELIDFD